MIFKQENIVDVLQGIADNQTDGTQKVLLVDGSGNVISSTGNALDVNIKTPATFPIKFYDTNGNAVAFKNVDGKPRFSSMPYTYDVAEGNIPTHSVWVRNGYNPALSATNEDLWSVGGNYVFPESAQQMEVVSSSANDTNGGTGVNSVTIYYLDGSFVEKTVDVTLNGTTPVATSVSDIYRVNYMNSKTVGTLGFADGNIDIRNLADTPIYCRILAGRNVDTDIPYTVPYGKTLYVNNIFISCASNVANRPVTLTTRTTWDRNALAARSFFIGYTVVTLVDSAIDIPLEFPTKLPAGTDIKVSAISPDGAAYGNCVLRGWLE